MVANVESIYLTYVDEEQKPSELVLMVTVSATKFHPNALAKNKTFKTEGQGVAQGLLDKVFRAIGLSQDHCIPPNADPDQGLLLESIVIEENGPTFSLASGRVSGPPTCIRMATRWSTPNRRQDHRVEIAPEPRFPTAGLICCDPMCVPAD